MSYQKGQTKALKWIHKDILSALAKAEFLTIPHFLQW